MHIDFFIEKHYKNRCKGFYFWTTKKNFLSCHVFSNYCKSHELKIDHQLSSYDDFFSIFNKIMFKIESENNFCSKNKCKRDWKFFKNNGPVPFLDDAQCAHLLSFLYKNKYSIEEFFVYICPNEDKQLLFKTALKTFTCYDKLIDYDFEIKIGYPINSLFANEFLYNNWDLYLKKKIESINV